MELPIWLAGSRKRFCPLRMLVLGCLLLVVVLTSHKSGVLSRLTPAVFSTTAGVHDSRFWRQFAYCTYATTANDLCNSVGLLADLHKHGAKADRLLLHPQDWDVENGTSPEGILLQKARDLYGVTLRPITLIQEANAADSTWKGGSTKFLAFNQTDYTRILSLDSDGLVMQDMDELFLLPPAPLWGVREHRKPGRPRTITGQIFLLVPSTRKLARTRKALSIAGPEDYDGEILNAVFGEQAFFIPHRPYDFLSGMFRGGHESYLDDPDEEWDPQRVWDEAKFVHFSDWPFPKPWQEHSDRQERAVQPKCDGQDDCLERRLWVKLYDDFRARRKEVCGDSFARW